MGKRVPRDLKAVLAINERICHFDLWACMGRMDCRSFRCSECKSFFHSHTGDGKTRCDVCTAWRKKVITSEEWNRVQLGLPNLVITDGLENARVEEKENGVGRQKRRHS